MRINDTTINNLPELITALSQDLGEFGKPVWFRGHSKNEWKLNPLLFRGSATFPSRKEINLIKRFKQDATLLINPIPSELYEWLFIMRHYGVPTRLLDWTESPLVGAYFAVNELPEEDGVLWALSPLDLNKEGGRELDDPENLLSFREDTEMDSYKPEKCSQDTMSKLLPIAFIAPRNTPRMQVQLSVFTIFHRDLTPIEEIGEKKHVWRYLIPKEAKIKIKKDLELISVGKFQLFPELESVGQYLRGR